MTLRIFVIDDQPVVCRGIEAILSSAADLVLVGCAPLDENVGAAVKQLLPDVILFTSFMSDTQTLQIIADFSQLETPVPVLVYGRLTNDEQVKAMLAAGAMGYALTTDEPGLLIAAIRVVSSGNVWLSPRVREQTYQRIDRELAQSEPLTKREIEVLRLIGHGYDNREIAATLYLERQTVKNYSLRVYQKLGVTSRSQAILRAIRLGLVEHN